jgi:hypothetical protein
MNQIPTVTSASPRENTLLGALGAFLFALAGGFAYYIFYTVGIIAALSGLIGVICAIKGYEIFARSRSNRGIAISVAAAAVVLILAWNFCFGLDIHANYTEMAEIGEIQTIPTAGWCIANTYRFLSVHPAALWDLLVSLALAAVGCGGYVFRTVRQREEQAAFQAAQARTMELARAQAEQAARASEMEAQAAEMEAEAAEMEAQTVQEATTSSDEPPLEAEEE